MRIPGRARLTYSNIIATLALFVALGGTGYAVKELSGKDIEKRTIPGNRLKKNAVGGKEVNEAKLGQVPSAALADRAGSAGAADTAGTADSADDASRLGGQGPAAFLRYGATIPSGVTITGGFDFVNSEVDINNTTLNASGSEAVSFPVPAPQALTSNDVSFSTAFPTLTFDESADCTGTPDAPTAPAGKVCLYASAAQANPNSLNGLSIDGASRFGFVIQGSGPTGNGSSTTVARGSWAYTAP